MLASIGKMFHCKEHYINRWEKARKFIHINGQLLYITEGVLSLKIGGRVFILEKGEGIIINHRVLVEVLQAKKLRLYWLQIDILPEETKKHYMCFSLHLTSVPKKSWQVLETSKKYTELSEKIYQQSNFLKLLAKIQEELEKKEPESTIEASIRYLQNNYDKELNIGALHEHACLTKQAFCRAFKRKTKMTPTEYVRDLRVKKAKRLLRQPSLLVKDVAQLIGYEDELYFSRVFKKTAGVSPTIYRKENPPRIAVYSDLFLQDHLLSLGITPVVAPAYPSEFPEYDGVPAYLRKRLTQSVFMNLEKQQDFHILREQHPNIILATKHGKEIENYVKDADIIQMNRSLSWKAYQREIARAVEREEVGEDIIKKIDKAERNAKDKLLEVTRKPEWLLLRIIGTRLIVYGLTGHSASDLFFEGLGFKPLRQITWDTCREITMEELVCFNPTHILFLWSKQKDYENLQKHFLWTELQAVKLKQVLRPDYYSWDPWGPAGRQVMIEQVLTYFNR